MFNHINRLLQQWNINKKLGCSFSKIISSISYNGIKLKVLFEKVIIFYFLLNIPLFLFLRGLERKLFDSVDDKEIGLLWKYGQEVGITVWAALYIPLTECIHIEKEFFILSQKADEDYEEKHGYLYLANCLLKGKHSFWHIVLLATHELTTDVIHQ